jgi:hypothetical protein
VSRELMWRTNRGLTKTRLAERMRSMFRCWNPELQQTSPRWVTRPMSKHQQNRFPRLAIVEPPEKRPTQQRPGPRWRGPQRSLGSSLKQATPQMPSEAIRMAVMPTLSRNLWFAAIDRIWNFLRSYFDAGTERRRGANVLSFRRPAGPGFRRVMAQESFASKKPNGSVHWQSDCGVAPKEGGRR